MMEPLGVAHNGVERLRVLGEDVLVIGCGPIGLLAQRLAKIMGAKRWVNLAWHMNFYKACALFF